MQGQFKLDDTAPGTGAFRASEISPVSAPVDSTGSGQTGTFRLDSAEISPAATGRFKPEQVSRIEQAAPIIAAATPGIAAPSAVRTDLQLLAGHRKPDPLTTYSGADNVVSQYGRAIKDTITDIGTAGEDPLNVVGLTEASKIDDVIRILNTKTGFTRRAAALAGRIIDAYTAKGGELPPTIRGLLQEAKIPITQFKAEAKGPVYVGDESTLSPKRQIGGGATTAGGDIIALPPDANRQVLAEPATSLQRSAPIVTGQPLKKPGVDVSRASAEAGVDSRLPAAYRPFQSDEEFKIAQDKLLSDLDPRVQQVTRSLIAEGKRPVRSTGSTVEWVDAKGVKGSTPLVPGRQTPPGRVTKVLQGTPADPAAADAALEASRGAQQRGLVQESDVAAAEAAKRPDAVKRDTLELYWPEKAREQAAASRIPPTTTIEVNPESAAKYLAELQDFMEGKRPGSLGTTFEDMTITAQEALKQERARLEQMLPADFVQRVGRSAEPLPPAELANPFPSPLHSEAAGSRVSAVGQIRAVDNVLRRNGFETVVAPIQESARKGDAWLMQYHDAVHNILSTTKQNSPDALAAAALLDGQAVDKPSAKAIELASRIRQEVFDPIFGRVSGGDLAQNFGPVAYVESYLPRIRKELVDAGITPESADYMLRDLYPKEFQSRFFKKRPENPAEYSMDLFEILPRYLMAAKREVFDIPAYMQSKAALSKLPAGDMGELAKWYADNYIGQPTASGVPNETLKKVSRFVSNRIYDALLGANPTAAVVNMGQTALNTFPELGAYTFAGMRDLLTDAGRQRFHDSGLLLDYPGLVNMSESGGVGQKARKALHAMFDAAEYVNRGIAYLGAIDKARAEGMAEEAAEQFAYGVVNRTQFTYGRSSPVYLQNQLDKLVPGAGQFMQYPLKEADFVWSTLYDGVKKEATSDDKARAGRLIMMLGGASVLGYNFLGDIVPYLAPTPRAVFDIGRYIAQVGRGDKNVMDIPADAIKGILQYMPGRLGIQKIQKLIAPDESSVQEAAPLK